MYIYIYVYIYMYMTIIVISHDYCPVIIDDYSPIICTCCCQHSLIMFDALLVLFYG